MTHKEREHGLGMKMGIPKVTGLSDIGIPCPGCGCKELYNIQVTVTAEIMRGGWGVGHYIGCPACPFASPMMVVSTGESLS